MAPPGDKDKDKDKDKDRAAPSRRRRRPPRSGAAGRPARPPAGGGRKPPAQLNIRAAASEAADQRAAEKQATGDATREFADAPSSARPETNGHGRPRGDEEWPDYSAQAGSWDPWDEDQGGDAPGAGVNRTLGQWLEAVVPPEAQLHFLVAAQEFAAGVQTTLEYHLRPEDRGDDGGAGALRIDIE